jgi:adenylate cyclase
MKLRRLKISQQWTATILSLLICTIFIWFSLSPPKFSDMLLERLNYLAYDLRLNLQLPSHAAPKNPIVIVDLDEKSLQTIGRWPWSREKLAQLVESLYQQGVTVVAFDMLFPETEQGKDDIFAKALSQDKNKSVLGIFFSGQHKPSIGMLPPNAIDITTPRLIIPTMESYTGNIPALQNAAGTAGAISVNPDQDGTIRRYNLVQRYQDKLYPALALEAVRLYLLENRISYETALVGNNSAIESITLGKTKIDTDAQGRVFIPFLGPSRTFVYYSASDVMNHALPPHQLENALAFVGTSAVGLGDMRSTPVESVYPGVEIHANVAEALLKDSFPYVPAWTPGAQFALLVLLSIILSLVFARTGPLWIISVSFILIITLFFASLWVWKFTEIVFPIVLSTFLIITLAIFNMTYGFFIESKRRDELKKVFEQYVPSGHVDEILKNPKAFDMFEGERKVMSVLFMDIRNFTSLSEKMSIVELKKLLNFFLTEMTSVIFKNGGTIDKYVGDMVMAFWGAPLKDEEHAKHAILAGLDMVNTTQLLQKKLSDMQLPLVNIGVGINTGMMDVGDMGSKYRRAYTVLGDSVNLGSRLESLTKFYGVKIICSENSLISWIPADKILYSEYAFRLIDKVRVKGKLTGVKILEPLGLKSSIENHILESLQYYEKALESYYAKDFTTAQKMFINLKNNFPDSRLYQIYLARTEKFLQTPPPEDWDGIWEHHEK